MIQYGFIVEIKDDLSKRRPNLTVGDYRQTEDAVWYRGMQFDSIWHLAIQRPDVIPVLEETLRDYGVHDLQTQIDAMSKYAYQITPSMLREVKGHIANLDSPKYAVRRRAMAQLTMFGPACLYHFPKARSAQVNLSYRTLVMYAFADLEPTPAWMTAEWLANEQDLLRH